jgi:hypothetical protein
VALTHITDHVSAGLARLIGQYQDKPRIAALLSSYLRRVQELEDATNDVLVKRLIDNAADAQLDAIGRIVGEVRDGKSDATFRLFILARIRINLSFGHGDDVIDVLNLVESSAFLLREYWPATMFVDYAVPTTVAPSTLIQLARLAKSAGVRLQILYGAEDIGGEAFSLCAGTVPLASTTEGGALTDLSTGGYGSGVVE